MLGGVEVRIGVEVLDEGEELGAWRCWVDVLGGVEVFGKGQVLDR